MERTQSLENSQNIRVKGFQCSNSQKNSYHTKVTKIILSEPEIY